MRTFYTRSAPPYPAGTFKASGRRPTEIDVWLRVGSESVRIATERPDRSGTGLQVTVYTPE